MIERLADANRAAKANLIRSLAEYTVYEIDSQKERSLNSKQIRAATKLDFKFVASLAPFSNKFEATKACLLSLIDEGEQKDQEGATATESTFDVLCRAFHETRSKQTTDEVVKTAGGAIPALLTSAQQAINCRDVLSEALLELVSPIEYDELKPGSLMPVASLDQLRNCTGLNLSHCLLAGADLSKAHLEGVNLTEAYLQGALMMNTKLYGANLESVNLQWSILQLCRAQWVNFSMANLQHAFLGGAQLQHAVFGDAHMEKANLIEASVEGAFLETSHLDGTRLYGINFEKETTLEVLATRFPDNALDVALFEPERESSRFLLLDERTEELIEWLKAEKEKRKVVEQFKRQQSSAKRTRTSKSDNSASSDGG